MDTKAIKGLGSIAKRASITVAISAVLMAGLHYAPLRGFSPGKILLGHDTEMVALPAAPEVQPNIRFVAIPARDAFAQTPAASEPAGPTAPMVSVPAAATVIPTPRPDYVAAISESPSPKHMASSLARPTARPADAPLRRAAVAEVTSAPVRTAALPASPEMTSPTGRELENHAERVPEPEAEDRSFELADLLPSPHGVLREVTSVTRTVGDGARYAVTGIADGAMSIVGR